MKRKARLFVIGYAREGFGFGRVLQSLLRHFTESYDVHQFEITTAEGGEWPWHVYHNQRYGDWFGTAQLPALLAQVQPDLLLLNVEIWEIQRYLPLLHPYLEQGRVMAYAPIDGPLTRSHFLTPLAALAQLIVPTRFAANELERGFAHERMQDSTVHCPPITVIPHGINTAAFFPYAPVRAQALHAARAQLFPDQPELQDAFIVFNGNRNQLRKRIDLTLEGFRLFAQDKPPQVKLYLHMGMIDRGMNVPGYAQRYGILDRLLYTTSAHEHPVVSDATLNRIYNACDVGLNTSMGEGWGLVSFEHAATGAAQIVPEHSACAELWSDRAAMLPAYPLEQEHPLPIQMQAICPRELAEVLETVYRQRPRLAALSTAAWLNATRPELQWDRVAYQFDQLFQHILCQEPVAG